MVATTGFFDGVHTGHRWVLSKLKETGVRLGLPVCVVTFWPHPRIVLNKSPEELRLLTSLDEKKQLLADFGIDKVIVLPFSRELSEMPAEQFIREQLMHKLGITALCVGYDHRMGRGGAGYDEIKRICDNAGLFCEKMEPVSSGGETVSSEKIRKYLTAGYPDIAAKMLGYPYRLTGMVVHGKKLGRQIGFPTANIVPIDELKLIPASGVYAVRAEIGGFSYRGMLYIGRRPTVNTVENIVIEANLFDFAGDLYDKPITVIFERYLRGDMKFGSVDEMVAQLQTDRLNALKALPGNQKIS